jgi:hypothetical protein
MYSLRYGLAAAIVYHNDFKAWPLRLLCEGTQTEIQRDPVIVDSYDNAEKRHRHDWLVLNHNVCLSRRPAQRRALPNEIGWHT